MELKKQIIDLRTSGNKTALISYLKKRDDLIPNVVLLSCNKDNYPIQEYSSHLLLHLFKSGEFDLDDYYPQIVDAILTSDNQTVLRNLVCCIQQISLQEYRESQLFDRLIQFLQNPSNKVALHVYSIYVLMQFIQKYPDLKTEVEEVIFFQTNGKSPAYQVALSKFRKLF